MDFNKFCFLEKQAEFHQYVTFHMNKCLCDLRRRGIKIHLSASIGKYGALRDLVPFVQFKKREKHSWRSVNFSKVAHFSLQLY